MKTLLLPFLICFSLTVAAQAPVITSADMPVVNDTFRYSLAANSFLINPADTDTNYTWDFNTLVAVSQYIDTFKSPINTNIAFAFIFNGADYGVPLSFGQNLANLPISKVFNFYNNSSARFELLGIGAIVNGLPLPVVYTTPDVIYKFPLTYGNVDSAASSFTVTIPTVGTVYRTQTRTNYADGWGTLILPSGSHQVLRIRSEIESLDSITGLPTAIPTTTIEYKWISKTSKVPLLEVVRTNGITTRVSYRDNYINFTSVEEKMAADNFPVIFPNPATDMIHIKYPAKSFAPVDIEIFDLKGNLCHIKKGIIPGDASIISIETTDMASGIYFIKLKSAEGDFRQKVMILKN